MDDENSYESDISESWSLVDINLNEESVSVTDAQLKLEESYLPDPKDVNLKKSDRIELEDFVKQCRESMTNFHRCCHSNSDSSIENNYAFKEDESDRDSEQDQNDSGDAESIEILDVDGNHMDSEIERIDISIIDNEELKNCEYQSDVEESWGGNIDSKNRSTSLTVISKRRNLVKHSKSSDDLVNSDISKRNLSLSSHSDDEKKLKMQLDAISRLPVYKHYRNNVVNAVLSLSMGIVFAGVACIAIGHFLGVHEAAETAVELVDALKKLQIENVALQSRWSQLNKDAFRQNVNSKFEVPLTEPPEAVSCKERPNFASARTKTTTTNQAGVSEIQSSLKSIQWLNKLENMINEKMAIEGKEIDFSNIGKFIHNQLKIINAKKVERFRHIEDSDRKISKLLQKIIERLSASQENIEKLYNRLIRLMDKVNRKIFSDKAPRRVRVSENDSVEWCLNVRNSPEQYSKSVLAYKFPQPEEFYETKNNSSLTKEQTMSKSNNPMLKEKNERKVKKEEKERKKREKRWGREKREREEAEKKWQKKMKHGAKIPHKITVKKNNSKELGQIKFMFGRFNKSKNADKKFLKKKNEEKVKRKIKKNKRPKILRVTLLKKSEGHLKKDKYSRVCSGYECFNITGYWVFKYADGREEFRRHQTLNDWQFERARGRREKRNEDDVGSWQFMRALARENERNDKRWQGERHGKNHDSKDFIRKPIS